MKRYALLLYILFLAAAVRAATPRPQPLYIVNGKETSEIRSIPPEDIENVEMLPADETVVQQELESTDNRLKRRVLKAVAEAPRWHPAQKNGAPVESEGVLSIQLPEGRRMPRQAELVIR